MTDKELRPCPFCGSEAKTESVTFDRSDAPGHWYAYTLYGVKCANRACRTEGPRVNDDRAKAINAWNTRPPAPDARLVEAAQLLEASAEPFDRACTLIREAAGLSTTAPSDSVPRELVEAAESLVQELHWILPQSKRGYGGKRALGMENLTCYKRRIVTAWGAWKRLAKALADYRKWEGK